MTTCPSGVDYMHLVELARTRIEIRPRRLRTHHALASAQGAAEPGRFRIALDVRLAHTPLPRPLVASSA